MEYNGKVYTVRLVHGIGRFKLKPGNIKPIASKTNDVLKSAIISHMNHSSADTLDKIEQMIKPQHSHLENANSREHRHHSNSSSSYTRFFILFVLVVIFCSYGYSEFEADEAVNVSIKCAPPSEYVFVDADEVMLNTFLYHSFSIFPLNTFSIIYILFSISLAVYCTP